MRWLRIVIAAFILVLVETTFLPVVAVNGVRPDLAFILVVFLAFYTTPAEGFVAFWLVGLMKDIFSAGPLGAYALIYAACGYELSGLTQKLFRENPLSQIALALPATMAVNVIYLIAMVFVYYPQVVISSALKSALICAVYTTALVPPLLFVMAKIRFVLGIRPQPVLDVNAKGQGS